MKSQHFTTLLIATVLCCLVSYFSSTDAELIKGFRPPSIPVLMMDPFVNIWVNGDNLTSDWTKLWTGTIKAWTGYIRIDGKTLAFLGPTNSGSVFTPAMYQQSLTVYPTRTVAVFNDQGIELNVTFASPQIPSNMDLLGLPTNYISYSIRSVDNKEHSVALYYDNTAEITAATTGEYVTWDRQTVSSHSGPLTVLRTGTTAQNVFGNYGDWTGIDWGYLYVSTLSVQGFSSVMSSSVLARQQFINTGNLPASDDTNKPRAINNNWPVLCFAWKINVPASSSHIEERHVTIAYDEISPIKWFGTPFQSFWKGPSGSKSIQTLLAESEQNYTSIISTLRRFDQDLIQNLTNKGGDHYATVSSLAFRQVMAGTKLAWNTELKTPWYFMKEISSDGDLSTVDVIFPASPFFIYHNAELLKLLLLPILAYGNNETSVKYNYPWAPHHLGFYPVGYILPKDQENMPVEESGNMILMILAAVQRTNSYSWLFPKYGPLLRGWAEYLVDSLPSPGSQLCTDDFLGPIYNDANLAAKGIVALSAYAELMKISGNSGEYNKYSTLATKFVADWKRLAVTNAQNQMHYKLSYNQTDSWSLKYNIAYEKFLNLRVFGNGVMGTELDWYENNLQWYGVGLQNSVTFTKLDWQYWVASGFSRSDQEWRKWSEMLYNWVTHGQTRVPLTDWYDIESGNQKGFQARPVVGALWAKMLIN